MKRATLLIVAATALVAGAALGLGYALTLTDSGEPAPEPVQTTVVEEVRIVPSPEPPVIAIPDGDLAALLDSVVAQVYDANINSVAAITAGTASGSGWVWDADGHVITNYHVVEGAAEGQISVAFADQSSYAARVLGFDLSADLAVLELTDADGATFEPLALGESRNLVPGQLAIAIGSPFNEDFSVSQGIVSAVNRTLDSQFTGSYTIGAVVQTDAALNPGNSGGPLLDSRGRVIGVNTQIAASAGQSSGVGYAVPVDLVKRVVPSLLTDGSHEYSFLGITGFIDDAMSGVVVVSVTSGGAAALAGLIADSGASGELNRDGDVILGVKNQTDADFTELRDFEDLIAFLNLYTAPDDTVDLLVSRDGETIQVSVTLQTRP